MPVPAHGQVTVTASAQQLAASTTLAFVAFTIKAPIGNVNPVYIGAAGVTTSTGHNLDPGDELDYQLVQQNGQPPLTLRPSDFWVIGSAAQDKVTWLGSPVP